MNDFEGLLNEVLREDAQVELRAGMEARILARVSSTETFRPRWIVWTPAVVCALLLAVSMDHEPRKAAERQRVQPVKGASINEARPAYVLDLPQRRVSTAPIRVRREERRSKPRTVQVDRLPRVDAIRIAPLEVAALSLKPLGIAALEFTETRER